MAVKEKKKKYFGGVNKQGNYSWKESDRKSMTVHIPKTFRSKMVDLKEKSGKTLSVIFSDVLDFMFANMDGDFYKKAFESSSRASLRYACDDERKKKDLVEFTAWLRGDLHDKMVKTFPKALVRGLVASKFMDSYLKEKK